MWCFFVFLGEPRPGTHRQETSRRRSGKTTGFPIGGRRRRLIRSLIPAKRQYPRRIIRQVIQRGVKMTFFWQYFLFIVTFFLSCNLCAPSHTAAHQRGHASRWSTRGEAQGKGRRLRHTPPDVATARRSARNTPRPGQSKATTPHPGRGPARPRKPRQAQTKPRRGGEAANSTGRKGGCAARLDPCAHVLR